jgi:ParB-like chromosome segregation protein Spo0J
VAVREDAVIEYAALMEQGSAAPAPILHRTKPGLRVLDGVQRLSAAELNGTTRISAYIVDTESDDTLAAIRVLANARMQGRAEPAEWTRRRAVEVLVVDRGLSCSEVAQMGGWKTTDVQRIADAIELQRRIESVGGPDLPDVMLAALKPYLQKSGILEQAAEPVAGFLNTIKQSRISVADAESYLSTFFEPLPKSANPFKTFAARLNELHEDPEIKSRITGRHVSALPRDVVLLRELKSADTVLDAIMAHGDRVANVDEFFRIIDRITKKLRQLAPNKQPQTVRVPADLWSNKR